MSTSKPDSAESSPPRPRQKYTIRFMPMDRTVEVDPKDLPYGDHGLPGSVLDIALTHDVPIDHACGGACACATCHVIVRQGLDSCSEPTDAEEDRLDSAYGLRPESRLACVCVPDGTKDLVVEVPEWNRNFVREGQ
jgi:ferredoxin, 2Fe-2S